MGDTSSTMNTRFIAALFVAAVAVAAAGEMDQYNTDVAFAEATSFVQSYLEAQVFEGKTNSAATKNAHCCKDSMGPVRKAVSRYNKSKSDGKQCRSAEASPELERLFLRRQVQEPQGGQV